MMQAPSSRMWLLGAFLYFKSFFAVSLSVLLSKFT